MGCLGWLGCLGWVAKTINVVLLSRDADSEISFGVYTRYVGVPGTDGHIGLGWRCTGCRYK